jgi:hypothetical protein
MRSNAVGYVAIFLALSGGTVAWAALAKNSVGSKQLKNDQVKSVDVRDDDLNGGGLQDEDLAEGAVGDAEVIADGLSGESIDESTLEGVGSVGDFRVVAVTGRRDVATGTGQANVGPYAITLNCAADGDITVQARNQSGENDSAISAITVSTGGTTYFSDEDFDNGEFLTIPAVDDDAVTHFVVAGANAAVPGNSGVTATGTFMSKEFPAGGGLGAAENRCAIDGTAVVND